MDENEFTEITTVEELDQAIAQVNADAQPLVERARSGETLTSEERQTLADLVARRTAATERRTALAAEAEAAAAEQDDLLAQFAEPEPEPVEPEPTHEPEATVPEPTPEPNAPAEPIAQEPVAAANRPAITTAPRRRPAPQARPSTPAERSAASGYGATTALVASSNTEVAQRNTEIEWAQAEEALLEVASRFVAPTGNGKGRRLEKTHVAQLRINRPDEFVLTGDEESDAEKVRAALNPNRVMANGIEGLVAAGGWCAPSEILYDIPVVGENATDGILSLPEMVATRGGVKSTFGPVWSDVFTNIGFHQTEAEAMVGDTKDCYEVPCTSFTETRLEVEGVCLLVPILTEAGFPELVSRYMTAAATVHARKMNAFKIGQIVTNSTAKSAVDIHSTTESTLDALGKLAEYQRWQFRMGFNDPLEVVLPHWTINEFLTDLDFRMGHDPANGPATEADLQAWFAARHLSVQFVYDWQEYGDPISSVATTFIALMYPAGTWMGLTKDVINLGAVYDSNALAVNTYTGTFSEEGVAVRKMTAATSYKVTVPICSRGRVGIADVTCS